MYLVIECCERDILSLCAAKDAKKAQEAANSLLEEHLSNCNIDPSEPDDGDEIQRANFSHGEYCAWSNVREKAYDAYCYELSQEEKADMLERLLADLCDRTLHSEESKCSDGVCDECPINNVMKMLDSLKS